MREFSEVTHFVRGEVHTQMRSCVFWCEHCYASAEHVTWARWFVDRMWRGHVTHRQVVREAITVECHGTRIRIEDPVDIHRVKQQVMYG